MSKHAKRLDRELHKLKTLNDSSTEFDYLGRAELARRARTLLRDAAMISRAHPRDLDARATHHLAVDVFRAAVVRAYPPAFWDDFQRLKEGNRSGLEPVVEFLEADPWFDGSGYTKAELIRYLRRIELPGIIRDRLREVVIAAVERRDRREFRYYCKLGRTVDSPELRQKLAARLEDGDPAVRRRARWVLDALIALTPGP